MKLQRRLRIEAVADLALAYEWYEAQKPGLGEQFLRSVDSVFRRIETQPRLFPILEAATRRAYVAGFPYLVFFTLTKDAVLVLAVLHAKRSPDTWRTRQ